MTIPTSIIFPDRTNIPIDEYDNELKKVLSGMYTTLSDGINGYVRGSSLDPNHQWLPILKGSTQEGIFTYTNQVGWAFRQGNFVDVWFDIAWTDEGDALGDLYVELPYRASNSDGIPYTSALQTSGIFYPSGHNSLFINAAPNTFRGEIWGSGSVVNTNKLPVPPSGRLIGSLRYQGDANES